MDIYIDNISKSHNSTSNNSIKYLSACFVVGGGYITFTLFAL